ncbi:MAG: TonB-dependent receptor plug domain-containing protein [Puniceicoccaceae bacterium]
MNNRLHPTKENRLAWLLPLTAGLLLSASPGFAQDDEEKEDVFELSPFVVDASDDMGYYASQSLAGGRLSTDIINTGSSIEVVTQDFMDDIGANDIQELLQYTNNTEIGGVLGNFVGGEVSVDQGDVNVTQSQRNPDANSRIRGLTRPDQTRDFYKTDIPFDQYNTERVDINRGSNSFLFGLGSPAGLINNQLAKAHFNDRSKIRFRLGSGGTRPSYRGEFDFNRSIIKDRLALRVAGMMNRQQYRQRPTYRNDDRIYAAMTIHPFEHKRTTIRAHFETGDQYMNNASTVLPGENLSTWIQHRIPIDVDSNIRYYRQQYGYAAGDYNSNPDRFPEMISGELVGGYWPVAELNDHPTNPRVTRDEQGDLNFLRPGIKEIGNFGAIGFGMVFDNMNDGDLGPDWSFQNQYRGLADVAVRGATRWRPIRKKIDGKNKTVGWYRQQRTAGDAWWSPDGNSNGNPSMVRYTNMRNARDKGVGWFRQGLTDLDMFDFSKYQLSWDNDFVDVDFYNYNFAIEQLLLDGKAGFEIAFDFQNHVRDTWTGLTAGAAEISIDINRTMPLPTLDANGDIIYPTQNERNEEGTGRAKVVNGGRANPNFGRPFVISKTGRGYNRNDRQTIRATAFYKLDFDEYSESRPWMKWLGAHTFSLLGDSNTDEYDYLGTQLRSFADDWDLGAHLHDNSARKSTTSARNTYRLVYIGPPVQSYLGDSVWDPNTPLSMSDLRIEPARYNLLTPEGWGQEATYWSKGSFTDPNTGLKVHVDDALPNQVGLRMLIDGDESWETGTFRPRWVPQEGVQRRHTEVKSWAINSQSFFLNRHLVFNVGYREDYIDSWLNKAVDKYGEDLIPDISDENFRWEDGEFSEVVKGPSGNGTFGYGAVLHWPKGIIKLPQGTDISFHYNFSENFVPDASRLGLEADGPNSVVLNRLPAAVGESSDYGVTLQLFDRKLIVRLNWYESLLIGRDSTLNNVYNQQLSKMFTFYGKVNAMRVRLDSDDGTVSGNFDGHIRQEELDSVRGPQLDELGEPIPDPDMPYVLDEFGEIVYDPDTGDPEINPLLETDDMVIDEHWPTWREAVAASDDLRAILEKGYWQIKLDRNRLTLFEDGGLDNEWLNGLTDLEDVKSTGFEASITWNPTRNWRMRINVAQQETVRSNIAPRITRLVEEEWLPWVKDWGWLDWSAPEGGYSGQTIQENVNENLLKYYTVKSLDGFPSDEVREWRVNLVTNYSFREGMLKGWQVGGSMRYQSAAAIGYPLVWKEIVPGIPVLVGDVTNPYKGEEQVSFDFQFGYSKKIWNNVNWQIQVNLRNLQNLDSDKLSPVTAQPDGSYAKVRWDPPFTWQITSTFRW